MIIARQLHLLDEESLLAALKLANNALKPGGKIALIDVFPGQVEGDLSRTVRELELALRTHGRPMVTPQQLESLLKQQAFTSIQFAHLPAAPKLFGLVLASKAAGPQA